MSDIADPSAYSTTVLIDGAKTVIASYVIQYYICVNSAHGSPTASAWVDERSSLAVSVISPTEVVSADHQWVCSGFNIDDGASEEGTIYTFSSIEAPHTISFNWREQFWITFAQSDVGADFTGAVVTIDGTNYTVDGVSFWWNSESIHSFSFLSPLIVNANRQYVWNTTTGLSNAQSSNSFQVNRSGSITGNYRERGPIETHDIAITNVISLKTVVGQGLKDSINVTVANQGNYTETFNVTLYASATVIAIQKVTLANGSSRILIFTWSTKGFAYGNYNISAYAWPVPGEINIVNNKFTYGTVKVTIPGDVDGDQRVTILDIVKITSIYGIKLGNPRFNPNCDLDGDGKITILDVVICAAHYGLEWP
jgi:hypothetical protein